MQVREPLLSDHRLAAASTAVADEAHTPLHVLAELDQASVARLVQKIHALDGVDRACVSVLHLYHPDPWPKKRHHKRRLVQPDFADAASRAIEPGGKLLVQSDHEEYFQHIVEVLSKQPEFSPVDWDSAAPRVDDAWAGTNFEIKYARVGKEIFRAAYERAME